MKAVKFQPPTLSTTGRRETGTLRTAVARNLGVNRLEVPPKRKRKMSIKSETGRRFRRRMIIKDEFSYFQSREPRILCVNDVWPGVP